MKRKKGIIHDNQRTIQKVAGKYTQEVFGKINMFEIEMEKNAGSGKLLKLTLISAGILGFLWLFWGFVTLRNSPCGWVNRLQGSECVRLISRRTDMGAEGVFFSTDNSNIIYLDRNIVRIEQIVGRNPFMTSREVPLISLESLMDTDYKEITHIDDFKVNTSEQKAILCVVYRTGKHDFEGAVLIKDLSDLSGAASTFREELCSWRNADFVPASSLISLDTIKDDHNQILFIDADGNIVKTIDGIHDWDYHGSSSILPVLDDQSSVSLYSFPEFKQLGRIEYPFNLSEVKISQDGRYIIASDSKNAEVYVMDLLSRQILYTFADSDFHSVGEFVISPDNKMIAAIFQDSVDDMTFDDEALLYVWNLENGELVKKIELKPHTYFQMSLDISADGKLVAVGTKRSVMILDITK